MVSALSFTKSHPHFANTTNTRCLETLQTQQFFDYGVAKSSHLVIGDFQNLKALKGTLNPTHNMIDWWQKRGSHQGFGMYLKADISRLLWTNGRHLGCGWILLFPSGFALLDGSVETPTARTVSQKQATFLDILPLGHCSVVFLLALRRQDVVLKSWYS